jgi:hypothetical protein
MRAVAILAGKRGRGRGGTARVVVDGRGLVKVAERGEVAMHDGRIELEIGIAAEVGSPASIPESAMAQTMSLPCAPKEILAASALTVPIDWVVSRPISKSGQSL